LDDWPGCPGDALATGGVRMRLLPPEGERWRVPLPPAVSSLSQLPALLCMSGPAPECACAGACYGRWPAPAAL
jgi:hypothetical protein